MDPSPHLGGVRARVPQALKVESGEQLGLCVTPDKALAPLLFSFLISPLFCGWLWGQGKKLGQAGVTLGAPGPQTNTRKLRGGRLAPGLQRRCSAQAWKGPGHTQEWGGHGGGSEVSPTWKITSWPWKMARKWGGSLPMVTCSCTRAPRYHRSSSSALPLRALISCAVAWRPCGRER